MRQAKLLPILLLALLLSLATSLKAQVLPAKPQILRDVELFLAVQKDDLPALRRALAQGARADASTPEGLSALHYCALHADGYRLAGCLLEAGASVTWPKAEQGKPLSPLFMAARTANARLVEVLLKAGADPKLLDIDSNTLLHAAIHPQWKHGEEAFEKARGNGQLRDSLEHLRKAGIPLDAGNEADETALALALSHGEPAAAELLVKRGARLDRLWHAEPGWPLHVALQRAHPGLLEALLAAGQDPKGNFGKQPLLASLRIEGEEGPARALICLERLKWAGVRLQTGSTLLQDLARYPKDCREQIAQALKLGLPIDGLDDQGFSAAALAAKNDRTDHLRLLLDLGASPTPKGGVPLVLAAVEGMKSDALRLLLSRDADPDAVDGAGRTALMEAAARERDHTLISHLLVEAGANPLRRDAKGRTALHYAARGGLDEVRLRWLLKLGLDVNDADAEGCTALTYACRRGMWDSDKSLQALLLAKAYAEPNPDAKVPTPLIEAIRSNNAYTVIRDLLDRGADPNRLDADRAHPLLVAMERWDTRIVEELERRGARLNRDQMAQTLPLAIRAGRMDRVEGCLIQGVDLEARAGSEGVTALMAAVRRGDPGLIQRLMKQGADPNAEDAKGRRVIHHLLDVSREKQADPIATGERLLQAGVDWNSLVKTEAVTKETARLIQRATWERWIGLLRAMREAGVDLDLPFHQGLDSHVFLPEYLVGTTETEYREALSLGLKLNARAACGHTPLLHLIRDGRYSSAELLLKKGADTRLGSADGTYPLALAIARGEEPLVRLLLRKGASPSTRDQEGDSPVMEALLQGRLDLVEVLADKGRTGDAYRGDYTAWRRLMHTSPREAIRLLQTQDEQERAKIKHPLPGIWTYGALASAIQDGDTEVLQKAQEHGVDFNLFVRQSPALRELALRLGSRKVRKWMEAQK